MKVVKQLTAAIAALWLGGLMAAPASAQAEYITVASTTSTEQSGLFDHILPIFSRKPLASRCG